MKLNSTQATFRILAGGYLIYLDYKMISDGAFTQNSGWKLVLLVAAMLVFAVFGAFFAYQGIKAMSDAANGQPESSESEDEPEEYPGEDEESYLEEEYDSDDSGETSEQDDIPESDDSEEEQ